MILNIHEIENFKYEKYSEYDGYEITTKDNNYKILIDNGNQCCESWGYFSTEDKFEDFIGSELLDIKITDDNLNSNILDMKEERGLHISDCIFVDLITNKGNLQFAVYNAHNGYYGHDVLILKDDKIIEKYNI